MHRALSQLNDNITRVRLLGGLYQAICSRTTPAVDCTDILRAQIVLAVSALDTYVHELTRLGMIEVYNGIRPPTDSFIRFQITMGAVINMTTGSGGGASFENEVRERHSYLSFQQPDRITDAIRLFSSCNLWQAVAIQMGLSVNDVRSNLQLIIDRRNKIAHEADLDPSYPGQLWPISPVDVANTVDFIERVCSSIQSVV